MQSEVIKLFNAVVVRENQITNLNFSLIQHGIITDFDPAEYKQDLLTAHPSLNISTLFSKVERENSSPHELIIKQILHYVEVNVLGAPGLFEFEHNDGRLYKAVLVRGITHEQLNDKIRDLLYTNAPVADVEPIVDIIRYWNIPYDVNQIVNNELRIALFDPLRDIFDSGDDVVRWMVYKATGNPLVIKSRAIINAIKEYGFTRELFYNNARALSEVFNRFKPIILAAKNPNTRAEINHISRMSKYNHKPVYQSFSKQILSAASKSFGTSAFISIEKHIDKLTTRDAFKLLNLIAYKRAGFTHDAFNIRNGSIWVEKNRKKLDPIMLLSLEDIILNTLGDRFKHLRGMNILLDSRVDYGLPISRKQTIGSLPFGTKVTLDKISSGIYWENSWGARDLDLSTVDINGNRTGWGGYGGYGDMTGITFSGDLVDATNGAMEFMTNRHNDVDPYGLFVNIYSGQDNSEFELIIGNSSDEKWMDNVVVREKSTLLGRGSIIGFVDGNQFIVYKGKISNKIANFGESNPVINRVLYPQWMVSSLLARIGIDFDIIDKVGVKYDFNLKYEEFSLDKLEEMLY